MEVVINFRNVGPIPLSGFKGLSHDLESLAEQEIEEYENRNKNLESFPIKKREINVSFDPENLSVTYNINDYVMVEGQPKLLGYVRRVNKLKLNLEAF